MVGALVDYLKDIFPFYSIEYVSTPLSRVPDLISKDFIHLFPMYFYSKERAKTVHFVPVSFHSLQPCLCALKSTAIASDIRNAETFKNKKITHIRGTLKNRNFLNFKLTKYLALAPQDYYEKSLKLLKLRRTHFAYYADFDEIKRYIQKNKISGIHCENSNYPKDEMFFVTNKSFYLKKSLKVFLQEKPFQPYLEKYLNSTNWQMN